jgi:hypothetical protein
MAVGHKLLSHLARDQNTREAGPYPSSRSTVTSGNMGPSDFQLCESLKKHLSGKWFATDADVKQAITSSL